MGSVSTIHTKLSWSMLIWTAVVAPTDLTSRAEPPGNPASNITSCSHLLIVTGEIALNRRLDVIQKWVSDCGLSLLVSYPNWQDGELGRVLGSWQKGSNLIIRTGLCCFVLPNPRGWHVSPLTLSCQACWWLTCPCSGPEPTFGSLWTWRGTSALWVWLKWHSPSVSVEALLSPNPWIVTPCTAPRCWAASPPGADITSCLHICTICILSFKPYPMEMFILS